MLNHCLKGEIGCMAHGLVQSWRGPAMKKFAAARKEAGRGVREAKNTCFLAKAREAQKGRHGGK